MKLNEIILDQVGQQNIINTALIIKYIRAFFFVVTETILKHFRIIFQLFDVLLLSPMRDKRKIVCRKVMHSVLVIPSIIIIYINTLRFFESNIWSRMGYFCTFIFEVKFMRFMNRIVMAF